MARTDDSESPNIKLHLQGTPLLLRSDSLQQNMLSFSSPRSEFPFLSKNGGSAVETPYSYTINSGKTFFPSKQSRNCQISIWLFRW